MFLHLTSPSARAWSASADPLTSVSILVVLDAAHRHSCVWPYERANSVRRAEETNQKLARKVNESGSPNLGEPDPKTDKCDAGAITTEAPGETQEKVARTPARSMANGRSSSLISRRRVSRTATVLMRTPGHDEELVLSNWPCFRCRKRLEICPLGWRADERSGELQFSVGRS